MELFINGHTADITIDKEKTVGDVMAGLEEWLAGMGHRLSGLSIDGQNANTSLLDDFFSRELKDIKKIDITTSTIADLFAESLLNLLSDIKDFELLDSNDKKTFIDIWKEKAHVLFTFEQMPDLYNIIINLFAGAETDPASVYSITEERLREVKNPVLEFTNLSQHITQTCALLCDLPLDIQTGKDAKAARTIQFFSGISEKIIRNLKQLDLQGFLLPANDTENQINSILSEFGSIVKNLLEAYEKYDTVLVGDIAEYEASPTLQKLYDKITGNIRSKND
ncbi:MAG: hypothetical protein FWB89_01320 [Treponema sp.]|nr:hypothetical protein [Treponema sp.]